LPAEIALLSLHAALPISDRGEQLFTGAQSEMRPPLRVILERFDVLRIPLGDLLLLSAAQQQQIAKRYTENVKAFQYYTQGRSHRSEEHTSELQSLRHLVC